MATNHIHRTIENKLIDLLAIYKDNIYPVEIKKNSNINSFTYLLDKYQKLCYFTKICDTIFMGIINIKKIENIKKRLLVLYLS
jgi:hypothetical protein